MKSIAKMAVFTLLSLTAINLNAKDEKPGWTNGSEDCRLANTYIKTGVGYGQTESAAREAAINNVFNDRVQQTGVRVTSDGSSLERENSIIDTKSRELDHWVEPDGANGYRYYILLEVKSLLNEPFTASYVTNKYGFSPTVFVPGMAQIRKGSIGKGAAFISSEVLTVGGVIISECMRSSYSSKIKTTHNAQTIKNYSDKANNCATVRNVCIGASVAVYLWNVIDGAVAKGKKHVVVDGRQVAFAPFYNTDGGGLAMCVTF